MKVVYLNPSGQLGGAEWSLLTLLAALQRQSDFEPVVVAPESGPFLKRCLDLGIRVEVLAFPKSLERTGDFPTDRSGIKRLWRAASVARCGVDVFRYATSLKRLIQKERPHIIHTNGLKMHLFAGWLHRLGLTRGPVSLVGHIHDYVSVRPVAGKLLKAVAAQFTCFIANSKDVALDLQNYLRTSKISSVYNAVDLERFTPDGKALNLDRISGLGVCTPGTVRIGLVATFARWKGHLTFLRALAKVSEQIAVRGYIIGGPIYKTAGSQFSQAELEEEVERLGLTGQIGFTGFVEDTAQAFRSLDFTVHASTTPEPFGMAIIEAMACGRAVIISRLGGAQELYTEGTTGLGHIPGNEEDLAAKMTELAKNPGLRARLSKSALEHVRLQFQPCEMARRVYQLYQSALDKNGMSGALTLASQERPLS